jgi:hypothetical protein
MFTENEILQMFKSGKSKQYIADLIFYRAKKDNKRIRKNAAILMVEGIILEDCLRQKLEVHNVFTDD